MLVASARKRSEYKKSLDHSRVPTVLINSQADAQDELLHWVTVDDCIGAQIAVEHLLQLGHHSIGYLGISSRPRSNRQRFQGYQNALTAAGTAFRDTWVLITPGIEASHEEDVAVGQASLLYFLEREVTAVFCYKDMPAIGLIMACRQQGITVPHEFRIFVFYHLKMLTYL